MGLIGLKLLWATRLYHRTGDLNLVQHALSRRHIATTEIYAKVGDEALRRAVAVL